MKVRVPKKIKIGGLWVEVKYENKLMDNHGKYGQSHFPECEIVLQDRDVCSAAKSRTLLHELIHFIDQVYNNYSLDENATDALASGIHALLVDMGIELDWAEVV